MTVHKDLPESDGGITRRGLLKWGGVAGVAFAIPAAGTAHVQPAVAKELPRAGATAAPVTLSTEQNAVLNAFVDRLIPTDATGPGALESGVATFITQSLQGGLSGGLTKLGGLYTANLTAVDAYAQKAYGNTFPSLSPSVQDQVLTDIESGKATGFTPDSPTFFATIREDTLEGMFSDPAYGGNKNFAGWKLVGYPGVKMPLPASDQQIGVKVKPANMSTYANGAYPGAKKEAVA
jgi:gluconate 2-dehydrogenase gamma chain